MNNSQLLIKHLGFYTAENVFKAFGGLEVYIPKLSEQCQQAQCLKQRLGMETAVQLMRIFGGETLYIPKNYHYNLSERNKAIQQQYDELISQDMTRKEIVTQLARQFNVTERWVYRILHRQPMPVYDERQLELNWN